MRKKLPERPNLEHLKSQAKDLLHALRAGDAEALQRFRDTLPAARAADDDGLWIVVRAVQWIELQAIEQTEPYVRARVTRFTVHEQPSAEVNQLEQTLRSRLRAFAASEPSLRARLEYVLALLDCAA